MTMLANAQCSAAVARLHSSGSMQRASGSTHRRWRRPYRGAVTTMRRVRGRRTDARSAATFGTIVNSNVGFLGTRTRALIALVLASWVVVVAAEWALPIGDQPSAHGPHALSSDLLPDHSVVIEHPHISDGSVPLLPDTVAEGVLPRTSTILIALGLIAALAVAASLWSQSTLAVVRGPPRPLATVISGRVRLTRLCIARC